MIVIVEFSKIGPILCGNMNVETRNKITVKFMETDEAGRNELVLHVPVLN